MEKAGLPLKGWKRRFSRTRNKNNKRMCQFSSLKAGPTLYLKKNFTVVINERVFETHTKRIFTKWLLIRSGR